MIRYADNKGIIRCNNLNKENVIKILESIENISSNNLKIITLGTSGTIKGVVSKHMNKININENTNIYVK